MQKIRALGEPTTGEPQTPLHWHFIGRLQANKTRLVAAHFDWVHGVDRLKIAERLSVQRGHYQAPLNVCLQINVAGETRKGGVAPAEAASLAAEVAQLPRLKLRGLMCMLPFGAIAAEQAAGFGALRRLLENINRDGTGLDTLSMGMSADLEAAVEQGSTMLQDRHRPVRRARLECRDAGFHSQKARIHRRRQHGPRHRRRSDRQRLSGREHRRVRSGRRRAR